MISRYLLIFTLNCVVDFRSNQLVYRIVKVNLFKKKRLQTNSYTLSRLQSERSLTKLLLIYYFFLGILIVIW
jgi:hypothetical protein